MLCYLINVKKYENTFYNIVHAKQNLNYITRINFAACMNYSTHTVFSRQRLHYCLEVKTITWPIPTSKPKS